MDYKYLIDDDKLDEPPVQTIRCIVCGSPFEIIGDCDTPSLCNVHLFGQKDTDALPPDADPVALAEFADGWDTHSAACAVAATWDEAHKWATIIDASIQAARHRGILNGMDAAFDIINEEDDIDARMDREMLLNLFVEKGTEGGLFWHKTFHKLWDSLEGI